MLLDDTSDRIWFELAYTVIGLAIVILRESWTRIVPAEILFSGFKSPYCERKELLSSLYLWLSAGVYLGDWRFDLVSKRYDSTLDCLTHTRWCGATSSFWTGSSKNCRFQRSMTEKLPHQESSGVPHFYRPDIQVTSSDCTLWPLGRHPGVTSCSFNHFILVEVDFRDRGKVLAIHAAYFTLVCIAAGNDFIADEGILQWRHICTSCSASVGL